MEQINICYMINQTYLPLTLTSIEHVKKFFRSKKHELKFFIIGIDDFKVPDDIEFIKSDHIDMPILWQRVYMPQMLGVDKFIFIDSDTIAMTCISKLWKMDLKDNVLAAAQHLQCRTFGQLVANWPPLNMPPFNDELDLPYFNCGVMMIDSNKWIDGNYHEQCLDAIKLYSKTRYWGYDEPGYNYVLKNKWLQLDTRWNHLPITGRDMIKPYILHYYGEYPAGTPRHNMF